MHKFIYNFNVEKIGLRNNLAGVSKLKKITITAKNQRGINQKNDENK
jgi:hypothetical protein